MDPLLTDMVNPEPSKRPNMDEVVRRFSEIKAGLSQWKLRSRFASHKESPVLRIFRSGRHWLRQLRFMARKVPAIPSPG